MGGVLHVLHTADLHIGRNRKYSDYLHQQWLMLVSIIYAVSNLLSKVEPEDQVWLILAGDMFDRNQDTKRDELALFLLHLIVPLLDLLDRHDNFRVFLIDGNHDRQPNVAEPSILLPLQGLVSHPRFHMALIDPEWINDCRMLLVPFGKYTAADFSKLIDQYNPDFITAHECLARIQTDVGWEPPRNQDHYVEINDILDPTVYGVFLGDIHRCQCLDEGKVVWYSGSPVTLDFGHKQPKGILHHKFITRGPQWVRDGEPILEPLSSELHSHELRQHTSVGIVADAKNIPWDEINRGGYIDIVVTPEVYQEINTKLPNFFDSANVAWEFKRSEESAVDEATGTPTSMESYHRPLRDAWIDENLVNLPADLRDEVKIRVQKDFEARG